MAADDPTAASGGAPGFVRGPRATAGGRGPSVASPGLTTPTYPCGAYTGCGNRRSASAKSTGSTDLSADPSSSAARARPTWMLTRKAPGRSSRERSSNPGWSCVVIVANGNPALVPTGTSCDPKTSPQLPSGAPLSSAATRTSTSVRFDWIQVTRSSSSIGAPVIGGPGRSMRQVPSVPVRGRCRRPRGGMGVTRRPCWSASRSTVGSPQPEWTTVATADGSGGVPHGRRDPRRPPPPRRWRRHGPVHEVHQPRGRRGGAGGS
jgi:hypothetical protein